MEGVSVWKGLMFGLTFAEYGVLTLSLPRTHCAGPNIDLPSNRNISKMVRVNKGYCKNWGQLPEDAKKGTFSIQKLKRAPLIWPPPMFIASTIFLIKQIFEKKKSHQGHRPEVGLSFNLK